MKVREPVARPLDVVAVELLLTASQAFLVGVLLYLAIGVWDDRGVGLGPAAIILALLGLAVGAAWLYWLLGGVGWPMAAANVPVAMFIGFAMVLAWYGDDLFDAPGVPRLLAALSAIFGIVAGVFLDSPRRWRWDQRQRLRPGTRVPRVSPTTRAIVAQMPRSMPRRRLGAEPASELAARIERATPHGPEPSGETVVPPGGVEPPAPMPPAPLEPPAALAAEPAGEPGGKPALKAELSEAPAVKGSPIAAGVPTPAAMPRAGSGRAAGRSTGGTVATDAAGAGAPIELPTSVEPKAQRSPWAWAAPPAWNRDEDDEAASGRSSKGS